MAIARIMDASGKGVVMRYAAIVLILLLPCAPALAEDSPAPPAKTAEAKLKAEVDKRVALLKVVDSGRRFAAAVELGKLRHPAAIAPLVEVLAGDKDLFVRRACARSLGEICWREAVPGLIEALTDPEVFVALQAGKALRTITGVSHGVVGAMSAEARVEAQARWRAWWASLPPEKRVGGPKKKPVMKTPKGPTRQISDVATLVKNLTSAESGERFKAAVVLGKLGNARAVDALCRALAADRDYFVRRACARSLGALGQRKAVPALIDALTDREVYVAIQACSSLKALTGKAPDFTVRKEDGTPTEGLPSPEQRKVIQTSYRTWWEKQVSKPPAGKGGTEKDGK
jgi:HEAT repeat protein